MTTGQIFPASFAQQGLWLSSKVAPHTPVYQLAVVFRLPYRISEQQLVDVFTEVTRRHETLRTTLRLEDGELAQVVYKTVPMPLTTDDITGLAAAEREERLNELMAEETATVLDLDTAPLWRARLVHSEPAEWKAIVVAHHAIVDATSIFNLRRELRELCRATEAGESPVLPELPIQYADFSAWQRDQLSGGANEHLEFWRARLAGLPKTHRLPTDRPRPGVASHAGAVHHFVLPAELTDAVRAAGARLAATPFMVLLAAFNAVVARLSEVDDVVIGTPVAGRDLPEVAPLIGMFVNTLVLRTELAGDPSFAEIVSRTRKTALDAWEHPDTPFDLLVEALAPQRDAAHNPLFQVGFNFLANRGYSGSGVEVSSMRVRDDGPQPEIARFDLHLDVFEQEDTFVGVLEYATDLFDATTASTIAERYTRLLTEGVAAADTPLSRLPLLDPRERARLLDATRPEVAHSAPLWERIVAVATQRAGEPAVESLTYAELLARATALGGRLPAGQVALLPDDLADLAVSVLGALHAGVPFLLPDPALPPARLAFLLRDAKLSAAVAHSGTAVPAGVPIIDIAADGPPAAAAEEPDALAWVCHPSTRSGLPKRVGLSRRALTAAADSIGALLTGDPVGIAPTTPARLSVPLLLASLLTGAKITPAPCSLDHLTGFAECAGTGLVVTGERLARPAPNVGAAILDTNRELVATGMPGDVYLTGPTIGIGYLDRPQPSAEAFPADPNNPGSRMFRTGLRARWRPDGHLILLDSSFE